VETRPMARATLTCWRCNDPVSEGEQKCGRCGADVRDTPAARRPTPDSRATAEGRELRLAAKADEQRAIEERVRSFLYLCPACGAFVRAEDKTCDKCGATLGGEEEFGTAPEVEELISETTRRCPECAATVPSQQPTCGVCSASLPADAESGPAPTPSESEAIARDEALGELEQLLTEDRATEASVEPAAELVLAPPLAAPETAESVVEGVEGRTTPPARTRRAATRAVSISLAPWREFAALVTGLAVPAVALAAALGAPGHEWGQLFLFGVLFGIGLNLTIPEVQGAAQSLPFLLWVVGTALLLAVPIAALTGSPLAAPAAIALVGAGGGLGIIAAWRLPRGLGVYLPWLSGLLSLTVAASVPIALLTLGDPLVTISLWLVGGGVALGPAVLLARRRWMTAAATRALTDAEDALSKRDYAKALRLYDETLDLSGRTRLDLDAALYGKGAALVAVGRLDDALAVLDRALSTNPRNEVAWVNKGTALTRMGRLQDALKCYNSAIKVNAKYEVAWNNKGNALSRLGKNDWALQCYEQALALDPSYRTAWVNKGYVLAKLGRFDEAAGCADRALQLTAGASA